MSAIDKAWFEAHPHADEYRRAPTSYELTEFRMTGVLPNMPGTIAGRVLVTQIKPGLRTRRFDEIYFVLDVEQ